MTKSNNYFEVNNVDPQFRLHRGKVVLVLITTDDQDGKKSKDGLSNFIAKAVKDSMTNDGVYENFLELHVPVSKLLEIDLDCCRHGDSNEVDLNKKPVYTKLADELEVIVKKLRSLTYA